MPSSRCAPAAVTATLIPTPTVARTPAGASTGADVGPPGGEPALDEDDGEGGGAEVLRELGVVELQAESVLAEGHAEGEEQQQARQPEAGGRAGGADAGQHDRAAGEQREVQLRQCHRPRAVMRHRPRGRVPSQECVVAQPHVDPGDDEGDGGDDQPVAGELPEADRAGPGGRRSR